MTTFTWLDELMTRIDSTIDRVGWMVMQICGGREGSPWAYTIGLLDRFDHPELIVTGVDDCCSGYLLNEVGERIKNSERFAPGHEIEISDSPFRFGPVAPQHWLTDTFAMWVNYHGATRNFLEPRALQLIWADYEGRFPDDPACDVECRRAQPLLSEPFTVPRRVRRQRSRRSRVTWTGSAEPPR